MNIFQHIMLVNAYTNIKEQQISPLILLTTQGLHAVNSRDYMSSVKPFLLKLSDCECYYFSNPHSPGEYVTLIRSKIFYCLKLTLFYSCQIKRLQHMCGEGSSPTNFHVSALMSCDRE